MEMTDVASPSPSGTNTPTTTEKRVCILTGARGRLGTAFCKAYGAEYDIVAVNREHATHLTTQRSRFVDPLAPDAKLAENANPVFEIRADLSEPGQCERVVEITLARYGRIDLLVNSAVYWDSGNFLQNERILKQASHQFLVNAIMPVQLSVLVAKEYWRDRTDENRQKNRNVVNISSTSGLRCLPQTGQAIYSATKAALNCLTAHLASEFEPIGVRVNALAPIAFGKNLSTQQAAAAVRDLDRGTSNGKIAVLSNTGVKLLAFGEQG
jgi:NAD(P)-dependent dehydrogenase (short-subunit alcohol dehydrogenase family)